MHSGWKMCRQGNSLTMETLDSNSSRQMAQFVCVKAWDGRRVSCEGVVICDEVEGGVIGVVALMIVECPLSFLAMIGEGGSGGDGAAYFDPCGGGVCGRELCDNDDDDVMDEALECSFSIAIVWGSGDGDWLGGA